ncbi:MAG: HNH endonuclease [Bacteroidaceae bacterium]|nr:HNH endonuclease [Bacteroidaceae bacterium]
MQQPLNFKFYPTLLDGFQSYLNSDIIYERYWGYSENPPCGIEEFRQKQFQSLIDRINRVPFSSEKADRGTVFNEIVDCMVLHKNSDKVKVQKVRDGNGSVVGLNGTYNGGTFYFPLSLCKEVADYYSGGLPQQYIQAILPTMFGDVLLYGYIDYVLPFCTHDLKTTGQYAVGNYKDHWQHIVYPYALMENGCNVPDFEYNVVELGKTFYRTYTESYSFVPERDIPRLTEHCEDFIRFLQANRDLITDKKIFNLR